MYKASKLEQYSIKDNFLKKIAFIPSFPCEKFFSGKKKLRKEANTKQEFFLCPSIYIVRGSKYTNVPSGRHVPTGIGVKIMNSF